MNSCAVTILGDDEVQHHDSRDLRRPRLVLVRRIRTFQALRDAYAADTSNVGALDDHWDLGRFLHKLLHEGSEQTRGHECGPPNQVEVEPGLTEKCEAELAIEGPGD